AESSLKMYKTAQVLYTIFSTAGAFALKDQISAGLSSYRVQSSNDSLEDPQFDESPEFEKSVDSSRAGEPYYMPKGKCHFDPRSRQVWGCSCEGEAYGVISGGYTVYWVVCAHDCETTRNCPSPPMG
ncbi:hypothetical protein FOZ62_022218, partial [Perkinsus olseni]